MSDDELDAELRDLDEQIAELRRTAAEIRARVGRQWDAPGDEVDVVAAITAAEEQEAFLRALEDRRERLLAKRSGRSPS
jgi:F0F1-type ATP synthase membrane subunit b/b'